MRRTVPTGAYREDRFLFPGVTFAATIVLRPDVNRWVSGTVDGPGPAGLEAYDPLRVSSIDTDGVRTPLAADLTAPFARSIVDAEDPVNPLLWFLEPDAVQGEGLFFLEPYQREKIPIVFVHGLLSEPKTWVVMANDLRSARVRSALSNLGVSLRYGAGFSHFRRESTTRSANGTADRRSERC